MIEYIKGNLFDTDENVIVHGCNAQGVMGSGVAKLVKEKYPYAFEEYYQQFKTCGLRVGQLIVVQCRDKIIINMISQNEFGKSKRHVSYDGLAIGFEYLSMWCIENDVTSIAMPKIGAGLGGGKWNIIEEIINSYLLLEKVKIYHID